MDMATARKLWIHCNSCFVHFIDKKNILFLLACQHVICEKCVTANLGRTPSDAPTYTCPMCKKQVRGRQVNNSLPTNLKDMFHPEPWIDGLAHDFITSFQKAHFKSLDMHIARKERATNKLDKDLELAEKICRKHYLENHRLRMERKQLEFQLQKVRHQAHLRKREALRRKMRQRTESHNPIKERNANQHQHQQIRKRPASVNLPKSTITSFLHNNNHSFDL
ncbi:RING finger protein vilya [Drosophila innubila]|uniref:RING finger protein vilya n=1 Tax=Drosophila innubila TaxID=198719 RepID=UPI00148C0872|nr:RING finger protein vilya [Drosophila innubila]